MERTIEGFSNYTVDENGIVKNTIRGRILSQRVYRGYKCVALSKNGKQKIKKVHRLVAEAFIPNPDNLPCINHIDENKLNNSVSNLEWCDYLYNNTYGVNAPLKRMIEAVKKPVAMCDLNGNVLVIFESATEAQRQTGIWQGNITGCCKKRKYYVTAGGYIWKYANKVRYKK